MKCGCDGSMRSTTQLPSSKFAVLNSCLLLAMKLLPTLRLWSGHKKAATVSQTMRPKSPRRSRDPCSAISLLMNYHTSYVVHHRRYYSAEPVPYEYRQPHIEQNVWQRGGEGARAMSRRRHYIRTRCQHVRALLPALPAEAQPRGSSHRCR